MTTMLMQTDAEAVRIRHRLTHNLPTNDLFIEVDDLTGNPVAAFSTASSAAEWLTRSGFNYVEGSSGIWSRSKKAKATSTLLGRAISTDTPSPQGGTLKKFWQQLNLTKIDIAGLICFVGLVSLVIWIMMED